MLVSGVYKRLIGPQLPGAVSAVIMVLVVVLLLKPSAVAGVPIGSKDPNNRSLGPKYH